MPKILQRLLIVLLVIAGLLVLLYLCMMIYVVVFEHIELKNHFNNEHINADYAGWEKQAVTGFDTMLLPENWRISENGDILTVKDQNGNILASGIVLEPNKAYEKNPEYLSALYGTVPKKPDISYDYYTGRQTMMEGSSYCIANITVKSKTASYIRAIINCDKTDQNLCLFFPLDGVYEEEALRSWVEALIYAYEYLK